MLNEVAKIKPALSAKGLNVLLVGRFTGSEYELETLKNAEELGFKGHFFEFSIKCFCYILSVGILVYSSFKGACALASMEVMACKKWLL